MSTTTSTLCCVAAVFDHATFNHAYVAGHLSFKFASEQFHGAVRTAESDFSRARKTEASEAWFNS